MADLDLDITVADLGLRVNGRANKLHTAVVLGELTEEDLYALQDERATKAPQIKKLRDRHHALARALASGIEESDARLMCNYSASRLSILKGDPAFVELVEFYRGKVDEKYYGMHERMNGLGLDAVDELEERLDTSPEDFSVGQLLEIATKMADRTGHGPTTKTQVDVKVGLADRLASARTRQERYIEDATIIDVEPKTV